MTTPHPSADLAELPSAEQLAQRFHEAYERLAPDFGYKTREASAKPWAEVPENNRALMTAVCAEVGGPLLDALTAAERELAEAERHIERGNDETMRAYSKLRTAEAERDAARAALVERTSADTGQTEAQRLQARLNDALLFVPPKEQAIMLRQWEEREAADAPAASGDEGEICTAWHYIKAVATTGMEYAQPAQCVRTEPHTVHRDRAGGWDGQWFTGGEAQYAWPMGVVAVAAAPLAGDTDGDSCICDSEQVDAGGYWVTKLNADAGCPQHGEHTVKADTDAGSGEAAS